MPTEDKDSAANAQGEFLHGLIASGQLGQEVLNEESLRRTFAFALSVDPNIGTSQSSCHVIRALVSAGVIHLNPKA
jgi:hypothetical protein